MEEPLARRVLREWRGYWEPDPAREKFHRITDILPAVVKRLGLEKRLDESRVLAAWREVVGEFLALHSIPERLIDGVLIVRVHQPTVHYELDRVWRAKILEGFAARFGPGRIKDLRFRIG